LPAPSLHGAGASDAAQPNFAGLMAQRDRLWTSLKWAKGVFIQPDLPGKAPGQARVALQVQTRTVQALGCGVFAGAC